MTFVTFDVKESEKICNNFIHEKVLIMIFLIFDAIGKGEPQPGTRDGPLFLK